ncbi:MAG: hypothetical protein OXR66_03865 [Candidatus Woesearchaeota archaeon]|nr:hypothetical protein [Candidatus Woesearchaeota archaeon]
MEKSELDMEALKAKMELLDTEPMSPEDEKFLEQALEADKKGETISLEDLKKELGV